VLEIEEQLRRYGEAVEHELLDRADGSPIMPAPRRQHRLRLLLAAAAALVVVAGAGTTLALVASEDEGSVVSTEPPNPVEPSRAGVFSTPTDTVLLFSDGIDGATAIDLDRRLAGRRVIEGERAGDQSFRLTLTGEQLVVGWGEIYAAPLSGGPSTKVAAATVYIPASEPGEVWTLTWEGGRIGAGAVTLQRVRVDGRVVFTSTTFDPASLQPVIGVPGGLAVNTPEGVAVWHSDTGTTSAVLGSGPATAATSDGHSLAWCEGSCSTFHVATLDRTGPPTAPHIAPSAQHIALSADGARLAVLRPAGGRADLIVTRSGTSEEVVVARDLDPQGALVWTTDGRQLFYTENSYQQASHRVGRYDAETQRWEIHSLPVGDGLAPLAIDRAQARSFFSDQLVSASGCRGAGGSYPSGRQGVCTFAFFTPDSPEECVADGPATIDVPDGVGLPLTEAAIRMQRAGLNVVGTGTPSGDPTGQDAVVRAQEPPAGMRLPQGACIGFRTGG
jgi:PASTA domain